MLFLGGLCLLATLLLFFPFLFREAIDGLITP
jgi:hypothetical protein